MPRRGLSLSLACLPRVGPGSAGRPALEARETDREPTLRAAKHTFYDLSNYPFIDGTIKKLAILLDNIS